MERLTPLFLALAGLSLWRSFFLVHSEISLPEAADSTVRTYIVHVQKPESLLLRSAREREDWHKSFLPSLTLASGKPRLVYSYRHAIGGFAARLTPQEAAAMETADGVLSVEPDAVLEPATTRSPEFLGLALSGQLWAKSEQGRGKVIGIIEQGFYPNHTAFLDEYEDLDPPPASWRGECDYQPEVCNNKLVGNRLFNASQTYKPRNDLSHGTHVASIAAGRTIRGANLLGEACGSASGMAPSAHLAFYTITSASDFLMAVEKVIDDGVDVLSLSIELRTPRHLRVNPFDIGTLAATEHGVFVSMAAGNDGPVRRSIRDSAPWSLSVGASTMDREVRVGIRLGNGDLVNGETMNARSDFYPAHASLPAIYPGHLTGNSVVSHCDDAGFGGVDVAGRVVLCLQDHVKSSGSNAGNKACKVQGANGKIAIILNQRRPGSTIVFSMACAIPSVHVTHAEAQRLIDYVISNPKPTISFEPMGTITGARRHPAVADFSSRGPHALYDSVLKPDILGPGVNVLAAYTTSPNAYYYLSGTSMACPHLSGIAALLLSLHPTWSPAMIRSAIMTTADWLDNAGMPIADYTGNSASLFAMGAGQVNGTRAADPGLVYDLHYGDYLRYVCGLGYTARQVNMIARKPVRCGEIGPIRSEELNYPSFNVNASSDVKVITRTVTNVGRRIERYVLAIDQPRDVWIDVFPRVLDFNNVRQNRTYSVTVVSTNPSRSAGDVEEGQLTWVSRYHRVRSPIAITFA